MIYISKGTVLTLRVITNNIHIMRSYSLKFYSAYIFQIIFIYHFLDTVLKISIHLILIAALRGHHDKLGNFLYCLVILPDSFSLYPAERFGIKEIISTEQKFFSNILKGIQRSNKGSLHIKMSIAIFSISNVLAKKIKQMIT